MLRRFVILLGLTAMAYGGLPPGRPLPDVPISLDSGKKLDLKQYRGKALVLALIATTCADCGDGVLLPAHCDRSPTISGSRSIRA